MPVESLINKVIYTGTAATDTYAYGFKIFKDSELLVQEILISTGVVTDLDLTTDYTVTGAGEASGGNVVLVAGNLPATKKLVITRKEPLKQLVDLTDNAVVPAGTTEEVYDRIVMIAQQLQEQLDRSILASPDTTSAFTLPAGVSQKFLGWDDAGTALENKDVSDLGGLVKASTAEAEAGTNDANYMTPAKVKSQVESGNYALDGLTAKAAPLDADALIIADSADSGNAKKVLKSNLGFIQGWIKFNGTGTIAEYKSFNVASITDDGTGLYTITWDVDFDGDNNYAITGSVDGDDTFLSPASQAAETVQVRIYTPHTESLVDKGHISVMAIGTQ